MILDRLGKPKTFAKTCNTSQHTTQKTDIADGKWKALDITWGLSAFIHTPKRKDRIMANCDELFPESDGWIKEIFPEVDGWLKLDPEIEPFHQQYLSLFQRYLTDRMSVDPKWRVLFDNLKSRAMIDHQICDLPKPKDDEAFRLFLESDINF